MKRKRGGASKKVESQGGGGGGDVVDFVTGRLNEIKKESAKLEAMLRDQRIQENKKMELVGKWESGMNVASTSKSRKRKEVPSSDSDEAEEDEDVEECNEEDGALEVESKELVTQPLI
ncbi:uncharacterized protein LOC133804189 isoform X2 [Humulus lupulus]|uniref:uncharacterized protein LOC133804189 isoform X2 n=1 Tax=Humulus lupulus TaxID=3486 RepID=UPI002B411377|nr:uncharacterized protein LOC133804189 isoform X2 [Humulus lupulus]